MASVSCSAHNGTIYVDVTGLQYPANQYSRFRAVLKVGGSTINTNIWTSSSTSNSTYTDFTHPGTSYTVTVYATYNGVEYLVGSCSG